MNRITTTKDGFDDLFKRNSTLTNNGLYDYIVEKNKRRKRIYDYWKSKLKENK